MCGVFYEVIMTTRSVAKHTAIQFASRAVSTVLGVVAIGIMTRALGPEGFGFYTTANAFVQVVGVLTDFGIAIVTVQLLAEVGADQKKILGSSLALRQAVSVIFLAATPVIGLLFPYPEPIKWAIFIFAVSQFANTGIQILTTAFQNKLRMEYAASGELLSRLIQLVGVAISAAQGYGLLGMVIAIALGNFAQLLLAGALARRLIPFRFEYDREVWGTILRRSWPIGVSIAFNVIYLRADALILSLTRTQAEVGIYGAAYRVIDVLTSLPFLFMGLVMPIMANAWSANDAPRLARATQRAFDFLSILALPLIAGAAVVGGGVMATIAGEQFRSSGPLLALLTIGLAAIYLGSVAGHGIVAAGLQRAMVKWYAVDAIISLALYLLLIPRFGAWAAAGVTVFSEVFIAVAGSVLYLRKLHLKIEFTVFAKALLAAGVMSFALQPIADYGVVGPVILGATIYLVVLWLLRAVPRDTFLQK